MNHQRYILLQLWLFSMLLGSSAQTTIYGIRQNDRFLSHKTKYVLNDDDALEFQSNRFYVVRADGTRQSQLYTIADSFYVADPGLGVHKPNYLRNINFNDERSYYCWSRSLQSDHFIVFWEPEFGADPTQAPAPYTCDPNELLQRAEKIYNVYTGQLGFSQPGNSPTLDTYKIIMLVHYTDTWRATGSGVDNTCGTLDVNPDAANSIITTAHEIGHTFQYIVSCDLGTNQCWRRFRQPQLAVWCGVFPA